MKTLQNPEDIDRIIEQNYTASFMNDAKWDKLITGVTNVIDEVYADYKLIYSDYVSYEIFSSSDVKPFFREPLLYREVEWIEFPENYQLTLRKKPSKNAGPDFKTVKILDFTQDIDLIKKTIENLGQFVFESDDNAIRVYAYR